MTTIRRRLALWYTVALGLIMLAFGAALYYERRQSSLQELDRRLALEAELARGWLVESYRVLARDQPALVDLVHAVLNPLTTARGGAAPLVETLAAYFECGCVATTTATTLHLSVRAVTYRLQRVKTLTGFDPLDPAHRYTLQTAVLGAQVLDWPARPLARNEGSG